MRCPVGVLDEQVRQYRESSVLLDECPDRGDSLLATRPHRRILALTHDQSGQPDKPPAKFTGWAEDLPGLVPDVTEGTPCSETLRRTRTKTA